MISENVTKFVYKELELLSCVFGDSCKKIMVKVAKFEGIFMLVSFSIFPTI